MHLIRIKNVYSEIIIAINISFQISKLKIYRNDVALSTNINVSVTKFYRLHVVLCYGALFKK